MKSELKLLATLSLAVISLSVTASGASAQQRPVQEPRSLPISVHQHLRRVAGEDMLLIDVNPKAAPEAVDTALKNLRGRITNKFDTNGRIAWLVSIPHGRLQECYGEVTKQTDLFTKVKINPVVKNNRIIR